MDILYLLTRERGEYMALLVWVLYESMVFISPQIMRYASPSITTNHIVVYGHLIFVNKGTWWIHGLLGLRVRFLYHHKSRDTRHHQSPQITINHHQSPQITLLHMDILNLLTREPDELAVYIIYKTYIVWRKLLIEVFPKSIT